MADTMTKIAHNLERPHINPREPMHPGYLEFGQKAPPADSVTIDNLNITDPEMWRQGAYWERFARMRDEAPLHWTPDSFVGPFWSVTRYEDIMKIDIDIREKFLGVR